MESFEWSVECRLEKCGEWREEWRGERGEWNLVCEEWGVESCRVERGVSSSSIPRIVRVHSSQVEPGVI